ncbi:hypothetical protein [Mycobacteroides abscessus]|uniref:hypothetical protein n=1 Tax=Mycobacteroides abscessus TaxID=36809 RepID=UPI0012FFD8CD|nr:hypothetical protein [Mycobacteroides abscessus]
MSESELLAMLDRDFASPPWRRAPELDDAQSIAFQASVCDLSTCHHPVHAFENERTPRRHIEWFRRQQVQ